MDSQLLKEQNLNFNTMSLDIVRKNSSSPFHLQRSMVDQGGSGGAYESGGFNPDMVYNNDAANEAVASFGKIIGAGLSSITDEDANKANIKTKERLGKKETRLVKKKEDLMGVAGVNAKRERLDSRISKVGKKEEKIGKKIEEYNKSKKPSIASTLTTDLTKPKINEVELKQKDQTKQSESVDWKSKLRFFGK